MPKEDNTKLFAGKGQKYHEHRPGYAFATFEHLFKSIGIAGNPQTELVVLDVGAGTGFGMSQLAGVAKVISVEPDPSMREIAKADLERRQSNGSTDNNRFLLGTLYQSNIDASTVIDGTSDKLPTVADKSIDLIFSGTAAHWFVPSQEATLGEWDRVLKPEGKVAILFSFLDVEHGTTNSLAELYKQRFDVQWEKLGLFQTKALTERFVDGNSIDEASVNFVLRMDREKFLSWLGTTSGPTREKFSPEDLECLNRFFDANKNKELHKEIGDKEPKEVIEILYKSTAYIGVLKGREVAVETPTAAR